MNHSTRNAIIVMGLFQGLLLLLAHVFFDRGIWVLPRDLMSVVVWYTVAIAVPTSLQLVVNDVTDRRVWLFGVGLTVVLALTAAYTAYIVEPSLQSTDYKQIVPFAITTLIGLYVLLPFAQATLKTGMLRPAYTDLFEFAWNNIITLTVAKIFTGIFWALLLLWAALFKVIGIDLFSTIFSNKYFIYPVTAAVFAFAIYLSRTNTSAVATVRRIILAVFKGLLPLLALISVLFLAALPVMGLKPLWATGKATALMLWLQILLVLFINAVFQDGQGKTPYNSWLRRLVQAALVLLPIYTILCVYSLYLRIDQHGWTTDRFWAALLTFTVGLHVVGYAIAALRRTPVWMGTMAQSNITVAAITVALAVLVNTPILSAQKISVASQVGRLLDGKTSVAEFDFRYLRFDLGRHGNAALAELKTLKDHPQAGPIASAAENALSQSNRWDVKPEKIQTAAQAAEHFSVYPAGETLDSAFIEYLSSPGVNWQLKRCLEAKARCALLALDLNKDNQKDYTVFRVSSQWDRQAIVLTKTDKTWKSVGLFNLAGQPDMKTLAEVEAELKNGNYAPADNGWQNLRLGKGTQQFRPE